MLPEAPEPKHLDKISEAAAARRLLVPPGQALPAAIELAREIASRPQAALRSDRVSS